MNKYHPHQVLRNLHTWAEQHPPRPVLDVSWDACWNCYTYSFPISLIRIEEDMLAPTSEPDIDPDEWLRAWNMRP